MEYFFIYLISAVVAIMAVYAVIRAIDYAFSKREKAIDHGYQLDTIRFGRKQMGKLTIDVSKTINDNLLGMFRNLGDGV